MFNTNEDLSYWANLAHLHVQQGKEIALGLARLAGQQEGKEWQYEKNAKSTIVMLPQKQKGGDDQMPRPLKYGQGSITERKRINQNGSVYRWYEAKWFDEYGKRQTRTCHTKEQARSVLSQFNKHNVLIRSKATSKVKCFWVLFNEWYDTFKKPRIQEKDHKQFTRLMEAIPKNIKTKIISQITDTEIQSYLLSIDNLRNRHDLKQLLSAFLKRAFAKGIIKFDVGSLLSAPKPKAPKRQILSRKDEPTLIEMVRPEYRNHVRVAIYTGCRYSELMRIDETHIDRVKKRIKVIGTKGARLKGMDKIIREIPLLPNIEDIIFPLPKISHSRLLANLREVCNKMDIKVTMHDFKHTFATRCREAGVDLKTYSEWLDHSDIKITADLYSAHTTDEIFEKEADKLRKSTPISTPLRSEDDKKDD
jgi:integrase